MAERDFHFEYENSIPVKKRPENRKKPKPSPPVNSRRNPSVAVNYESPYDEVPGEKTAYSAVVEEKFEDIAPEPEREEKVYIEDIEDDVKIYSRKKDEKKLPEKSGKLMYLAIALIVIGICFLGVGIYFWITNFL